MSQWDFGIPPTQHHDSPFGAPGDYGQYDQAGDFGDDGDFTGYAGDGYYGDYGDEAFSPITYERDPYANPRLDREPPTQEFRTVFEPQAQAWPDESWPPRAARYGGRRRWLVPGLVAGAAAAVGLALFLTGGGGGSPAGATRSAPPLQPVQPARPASPAASTPPAAGALTMTRAQQVLAGYTTANNQANAQRSDTTLATIETGSSFAIDAGLYRGQQAQNAAPYPAFGPRRALYYIPRQPAGAYPRWFAVQVFNADLNNPKKITGTEYLLFTQAAPGAPWKNAIEPYVLSGARAPLVAVGADGLATPVTPGAASLAVSPARIGQLTAVSLDGAGPLGDPGNLADRLDQGFWRSKIPAASVTDQHAAAGGQVFGLATADGGALLFYTETAELTLTPPQGEALHLSIPGFYSPGQALSRAGVGYLEQFATYVPPRGGSGLRVVADYSGITAAH